MKRLVIYRILSLAIFLIALLLLSTSSRAQQGDATGLLNGQWKRNRLATQRFDIEGLGIRNNPLRTQLQTPFTGDELFVRFRIRYRATSIDTPEDGDGEFFVMWLDKIEGNESSGHAGNVPNIGIHVNGMANRFMVRFSPASQRFAAQLEGDRDFLVVGRLWKSVQGAEESYNKLDMWIDPADDQEFDPHASTAAKSSIKTVSWIGFSTGRKTEIDDRIQVWDIEVKPTWEQILGLPPKSPPSQVASMPRPKTVDFKKDVHPILSAKCFSCHAGTDAEEGVRLDVLDEVLNRTEPGNGKASQLVQLVTSGDMPPEGDRLGAREIEVLSAWIDEGLQWDEQLLPTPVPQTDHWAFQPIARPAIPSVADAEWVRTPIDSFIAVRHEALGLKPSPEADPATLRRRRSLDMLGLPPGVTDSHDAFDTDALLSNPAYGQRWARFWLDVVRWAESNGHQHNRKRDYAWRYRDWVIKGFNEDRPFTEFVKQQIAGDQLESPTAESLIATGFLAATRYSGNELDKEIQRNDILVDIVNTTASAFLGLTLECAQCHTHKFDPISIRDYYRMQAFFADAQPGNLVLSNTRHAQELIRQRWEIFDRVHARMVSAKRKQGHPEPIYVIPKSVIGGMTQKEKARFQELEREIAAIPQAWGYASTIDEDLIVAPHDMRWPLPRNESPGNRTTSILVRGDINTKGPTVEPGWPTVFDQVPRSQPRTRVDLASWLTDERHPLTARVWVNRIWQWHFGRGLVETGNDFGTQGDRPSHPELLDYLASELISSGWRTNHIHRLILDSATYRQSSEPSESNTQIDPENRMWWRWAPRRLESEAIRDSLLAVAGRLDLTAGGPSDADGSNRRSIYIRQHRDRFPHQQVLFDSSDGVVSCARRRTSTNALQPLWLLNSELVQSVAADLADRAGSVDDAFRIALGREMTDDEHRSLAKLEEEFGLQSVCLAILNSSEFVYLP